MEFEESSLIPNQKRPTEAMDFPSLPYDPTKPPQVGTSTELSVKIKQEEDSQRSKDNETLRTMGPSPRSIKQSGATEAFSDLDAPYELETPKELETPTDLVIHIPKIIKFTERISKKSTAEKREILQREDFFKCQLEFCKTVNNQAYYCMGVFAAIGCVNMEGIRYTTMLSNDDGVWGTLFRFHKQFCTIPELRQRYLSTALQIASSAGFALLELEKKSNGGVTVLHL